MTLHFSWITSPQSWEGSWWIITILCVLVVDILFMWTLISCVIHIIFRNGVNTELANEEFVGLKLLIARMFKDKTYLSLWELMLTREPYCSEYKVRFLLIFFLKIVSVLLSNTHCLNKYLECIFSPRKSCTLHTLCWSSLSQLQFVREGSLHRRGSNQTPEHPFSQTQWTIW